MADIVGILKGDVGWGCSANSEEELACAGGSCKCERQIKQAAADEIERMRTALEYIVEYCEETSLSRDDKIAHTLRKARTALGEKE